MNMLYAVAVVATRPDNNPKSRCYDEADKSVARGREVGLKVYHIGADDKETAINAATALFRSSYPEAFGWGPLAFDVSQPADSTVLNMAHAIQVEREAEAGT